MFWQWTLWQIEIGLAYVPENYRGLIMLTEHSVMMERLGLDFVVTDEN